MDVSAWERRLAPHAPALLALLGTAVIVAGVAQVLAAGVGVFAVAGLGLCLALAAGLFGLSYWLAGRDLRPDDAWAVVRWCVGGFVAFALLSVVTVAIRVGEGHAVGDAALVVLVMAAGGGVGGGVAGINSIRANRSAREADRRRDALVFLNSHLRHNVLNATQVIQGYASLLAERTQGNEQYLEPIQRRTDTIASLIGDVKPLADVFSGDHSPTPTDISPIILREVAAARERHEDATFDVDVSADVYVMATDAVAAVFANLLQNAVEHNDAASPTVSMWIESTTRWVSVHIADDGPGVREPMKRRLFDSPIESGEGRGIALVKTLMNHYGGDIEARDNDPRGTDVVVRFRRPPPGKRPPSE
ncbi:ATP-binding protein [Haloplanus halobius]|uniref:ATP-binding protein n=1 Tax=Haloplanus halobius TaxID=2934938 RepID=UPI00200DDE8C|nr:ATP-binding protein [Haloplanus sp. XH21]